MVLAKIHPLEKTISQNYSYDETFYKYIQTGAVRSAQIVVPLALASLKVESVLDVGCGAGAWLSLSSANGVENCIGVDGDYVTASSLLIPSASFIPRDISQPFDLERRFDLVQCLEVGEHIEHGASRTLVANLLRHGDFVLFSAAVPGQGGENHINEQTYEFWRGLFAECGYEPFDFLRPLLRGSAAESWYRFNSILYVAKSAQAHLPMAVQATKVLQGERIKHVSGMLYRIRTSVLSALPVSWLSRLAILKHRSLLLARAVSR